jgi:hypothetical protein
MEHRTLGPRYYSAPSAVWVSEWSAVLLPVHARDELSGSVVPNLLEAVFGVCALTRALSCGDAGQSQETAPEGLRSRVVGAASASCLMATPLGGLTAGIATETVWGPIASGGRAGEAMRPPVLVPLPQPPVQRQRKLRLHHAPGQWT